MHRRMKNIKINSMKIFYATLLTASMMSAWLPIASYSQETSESPTVSTLNQQQKALKSLVSTNCDERLKAAIQLDGDRRELIKNLMKILNSTNAIEIKIPAAVVLGEYQAEEAVPFLVNHLEWEASQPNRGGNQYAIFDNEKDEIGSWPVSFPLVNIGMPAIPAVLKKITQTDDPKIIRVCLYICRRIEGMEVTQFRVQKLLDKVTDQTKKARIQAALEM